MIADADAAPVLVDTGVERLHHARDLVAGSVHAEVVPVVQVARAVTSTRVSHLSEWFKGQFKGERQ